MNIYTRNSRFHRHGYSHFVLVKEIKNKIYQLSNFLLYVPSYFQHEYMYCLTLQGLLPFDKT